MISDDSISGGLGSVGGVGVGVGVGDVDVGILGGDNVEESNNDTNQASTIQTELQLAKCQCERTLLTKNWRRDEVMDIIYFQVFL
jgi:ATP phosphoribosyltransferase